MSSFKTFLAIDLVADHRLYDFKGASPNRGFTLCFATYGSLRGGTSLLLFSRRATVFFLPKFNTPIQAAVLLDESYYVNRLYCLLKG